MDSAKSRILEDLGGISEEVYDSLVLEFVKQTRGQLMEMRGFLKYGDKKQASEVMHSIKGCASSLRLTEAMEAAKAIELAIKSGAPKAEIELASDKFDVMVSGIKV